MEDPDAQSRFADYCENKLDPPLVEVGPLQYLIDAMFVLEPIRHSDGMRRAADWPEIGAYISSTLQIEPGPEAEILHNLCGAFLRGIVVGENPAGRSPVDQKKLRTRNGHY